MRWRSASRSVPRSSTTDCDVGGFPASGPAAGDIVEVKGTTMLEDGALKAVKVQKEDGGLDGRSGDEGELEGS